MRGRLSRLLGLVRASVAATGLPVPAPRDVVYRWALRGSVRPESRGKVGFYTGGLYQLAPYIKVSVSMLERLERLGLFEAGLSASRIAVRLRVAGFLVRPPLWEVERSESIVSTIYRLMSSVVDGLFYPYKRDLYTGVILYELGLEEDFARHARRVARAIEESGASELVTIDPHTTHILRSVMPRYVDGFGVPVKSYLEVLDEAGYEPPRLDTEAVLHDACYYARFEGVIGQPRRLLGKALRLKEPPRSGRRTFCCGGPLEAVSPALSKRIARLRMDELSRVSGTVIVACPICMINLESVAPEGVRVVDASQALKGLL